MISMAQLTEFLGWASLLNMAYLFLVTMVLTFMRAPMLSIHARMFDLDEKQLGAKYFDFLSNYKIATLVFVIAPYAALKIIGH